MPWSEQAGKRNREKSGQSIVSDATMVFSVLETKGGEFLDRTMKKGRMKCFYSTELLSFSRSALPSIGFFCLPLCPLFAPPMPHVVAKLESKGFQRGEREVSAS